LLKLFQKIRELAMEIHLDSTSLNRPENLQETEFDSRPCFDSFCCISSLCSSSEPVEQESDSAQESCFAGIASSICQEIASFLTDIMAFISGLFCYSETNEERTLRLLKEFSNNVVNADPPPSTRAFQDAYNALPDEVRMAFQAAVWKYNKTEIASFAGQESIGDLSHQHIIEAVNGYILENAANIPRLQYAFEKLIENAYVKIFIALLKA
jgi:hypothetical protein